MYDMRFLREALAALGSAVADRQSSRDRERLDLQEVGVSRVEEVLAFDEEREVLAEILRDPKAQREVRIGVDALELAVAVVVEIERAVADQRSASGGLEAEALRAIPEGER